MKIKNLQIVRKDGIPIWNLGQLKFGINTWKANGNFRTGYIVAIPFFVILFQVQL